MPNTKSKKFDFSILLASLSIVLVICCAVICCVIGIGTDNQVAQAYTSEEIGYSNLVFEFEDTLYVRDLVATDFILEETIMTFGYFMPNLMVYGYETGSMFTCGTFIATFDMADNSCYTSVFDITCEMYQGSDSEHVFMYFYLTNRASGNECYLIDFDYNFVLGLTEEQIVYYSTFNGAWYSIDFSGSPSEDNVVGGLCDASDLVYQDVIGISNVIFRFNAGTNCGIFMNNTTAFSDPATILPTNKFYEIVDDTYNSAYEEGFDDGSNEGYGEGFDDGYYDGYADGSIDSQNHYEPIIESLETQISNRDDLINQLREELAYYRSLDLNYQEIQVFNIARCKPSTFVYDGVTYMSNSIVRTNDGWDIYSSTYLNEELPDNYGVGFSLFLEETISNSKFHIYPDIISWYNYTYCSPPAQDGSQECYQVNQRNTDFSVGYRTQNGNIVKIGEFSNSPGMSTGNFVINQPTNEIVFFREDSNLMQLGNAFSLITYQFDTESIYNDGYENGKTQGIQIGRQEGYNQGVLDANDYSFFSLFTSVFDAPISAIVGKWGDSDGDGVYAREGGMLNFYIPGLDINFAPFLLSLFTIAIIVLVIRFIMARKS